MSDWKTCTLEDACEIFDGPHATPEKQGNGPYFLSISSLQNGHLDLSESAFISEKDYSEWTRRVAPRYEDIVFSYETRLGQAAMIPNGLRCCLGRRMGLLRSKDKSFADPVFLLHYYLGDPFQQVIRNNTVFGTTVDRIPLQKMGGFEIALPPLPEQKKIAEILSGIDRLVKAKERRVKQRKLLLKSALEDATKKEASDNFVPLSDLGRWRGGGTPSKSIPEYWGGVIPWVSPKDMKGRKISCSQDAITQEALENSTASLMPKDSILFVVRSGILRHTFPIALATREVAINQDLKALTVNDHCNPNFLLHYLCCRSEEMLASCMKSGTTVESIDTNSLQNYKVPVISIKEQLRLSLFAESITTAIEAEETQVESLKMLKLSLGSDLLSGRKRVNI